MFWHRYCVSCCSPTALLGPWNVLSPGAQSPPAPESRGCGQQAADSHTLSDSLQSSGNWSDDLHPASAQESQTGDRTADKNSWSIAQPGLRCFFFLFPQSIFHFPLQAVRLLCAASLLALLWFLALSWLLLCFQSGFPSLHSYDYMAEKLINVVCHCWDYYCIHLLFRNYLYLIRMSVNLN